MNQELVIINSVGALYWNSQLETKLPGINDTIKDAVANCKAINKKETEITTSPYISLRDLIYRLVTINTPINKVALKTEVVTMANRDEYIADVLCEIIDQPYTTSEDITNEVRRLLNTISLEVRRIKYDSTLRDISSTYLYGATDIDPIRATRDIIDRLEEFKESEATGSIFEGIGGVTNSIDFDNEEEIKAYFEKVVEEVSPEHILKTGSQGLNKLLGEYSGFKRSECVVVGGLSHHGKSILALSIIRSIAMYNTPICNREGAVPTILIVSAENELTTNLRELYSQCYYNTYKTKAPGINKINPAEAAKFIKETLGKNGWKVEMVRINPDLFTIDDLQDILNNIESNNGEVIACCFDYLSMISSKGIDFTMIGQDKQGLWKRARNMMTARNIFFISPHQLNTEAQAIAQQRPAKFLDEILNYGYYMGCRSLHQEVDLELNIQKILVNGTWYLGIGRGKHRGVAHLNDERVVWYAITDNGIPDDINGESNALSKPGATGYVDEYTYGAESPDSFMIQ